MTSVEDLNLEGDVNESESSVSTSSDFGYLEDSFTFELQITCDPPPLNIALELADKGSKVTEIKRGSIYGYTVEGEPVELSSSQLKSVAYPFSLITLIVRCYQEITSVPPLYLKEEFKAQNEVYFTVEELVDCLTKFETKAREHRRIGGLIDLTHRNFIGLLPSEEGGYEVQYD